MAGQGVGRGAAPALPAPRSAFLMPLARTRRSGSAHLDCPSYSGPRCHRFFPFQIVQLRRVASRPPTAPLRGRLRRAFTRHAYAWDRRLREGRCPDQGPGQCDCQVRVRGARAAVCSGRALTSPLPSCRSPRHLAVCRRGVPGAMEDRRTSLVSPSRGGRDSVPRRCSEC